MRQHRRNASSSGGAIPPMSPTRLITTTWPSG